MKTPQQKRFSEIINWQPFIHTVPIFTNEHNGAWSPSGKGWKGESLQISCPAHREYNEVMSFAEHETGKSDWIVRDGFPIQRKDGVWAWVLLR